MCGLFTHIHTSHLSRDHEVQRKKAVEMMLARTTEQAEEENAVSV